MSGIPAIAMGCVDCRCHMKPFRFHRRAVGDHDVQVELRYCGVCHSDVHFARNDLSRAVYPMVPGHELSGVCVAVGGAVTKFAVGDHVGVGCFVDSCLECGPCQSGREQYCSKGMTMTYGGQDRHGRAALGADMAATYGGYSTQMVVHERFAIKIPKEYPLEKAGVLLCAAVSMYDPLKEWGAKAGTRVGIVGIGGLGHMGVKLAKALGCSVTAVSRSEAKRAFAEQLGADRYVSLSSPEQLAGASKSLDLILNTICKPHDIAPLMALLDVSGTLVQLGLFARPPALPHIPMMFGRTSVAGSLIGGIRAQQEVIEFCAERKIYPEVEVRPVSDLGDIFEKLDQGNDSGLRYVLDIATLTDGAFQACEAPPPKFQHVTEAS